MIGGFVQRLCAGTAPAGRRRVLAVEGKSSEIHQLTALLDTLTGLDLAGTVITADALHTQREQVADLHARGAHWVLKVKGNQPRLRCQLAELPWREVAEGHRSADTGHGRREIRVLKVVTIAAGIASPPGSPGTGRSRTACTGCAT